MNASLLIASVVAGILSAFGVLIVIVLACIAIGPRQVPQIEMRVMREMMAAEDREEEQYRVDVTAGVLAWKRPDLCVASLNPDGSVAVARELSAENKSAV